MPPSATPPPVIISGTQTHIGVPPDYKGPHASAVDALAGAFDTPGQRPYSESQMGMANLAPRYKTGAELAPLNTPEIVPQLQAQMIKAGLLDAKNIRPGIWDSTSQAAYKKVLAYANQQGLNAQQAMALLGSNPKLGATHTRAPLTIQETNPVDIMAVAQQSAQSLLGRNLSPNELEPFVKQYQSQEASAQKASYKIGNPDGSGGVAVYAPTVAHAADDYYQKQFGDEHMGYAAVERMNEFYSLLHSQVK